MDLIFRSEGHRRSRDQCLFRLLVKFRGVLISVTPVFMSRYTLVVDCRTVYFFKNKLDVKVIVDCNLGRNIVFDSIPSL